MPSIRRGGRGGYPSGVNRYRCNACGNLTRFEVVETRTVRAYHHYTVGGELTVEDETELSHRVDSIACRWCGHGAELEVLDGEAPAHPS